jgi:hypothetical protein
MAEAFAEALRHALERAGAASAEEIAAGAKPRGDASSAGRWSPRRSPPGVADPDVRQDGPPRSPGRETGTSPTPRRKPRGLPWSHMPLGA